MLLHAISPRGGFPGGSEVKTLSAHVEDTGSIPGSGGSRKRKQQPTPVLLSGEVHGQRSPAGYSPWGRRVGHDFVTKQQQMTNLSGGLRV